MKRFRHSLQHRVSKTTRFFFILCLFSIVCIPWFLSLEAHWSSDEARWLRRSAQFMSAVKKGEFSDTLIAYHPGVTTMWIAGLRTFFIEPHVDVPNLTRARWFIGIVALAGVGIACLLLCKLFGQWVALTSFACLAYSPLFLAQTRRVHTDALAAVFILLTVLLFLLYCQNRQHRRNAAISAETSHFTTMGMETGMLKGLFVNRFSLREARSFHPSAVENTVDFGVFTVSLETLFSAIGHKQIDLLRLDVEGAEVPILKAYPFDIKPHLLSIEHHSKTGETFVRRVLETQGYRIDAENTEELRGFHKV